MALINFSAIDKQKSARQDLNLPAIPQAVESEEMRADRIKKEQAALKQKASTPIIQVSDLHNLAAKDSGTFLEDLGSDIATVPKFIAASIVAGANEIYNIAPTLGNYFGGDFEQSDTADLMKEIDSAIGTDMEEFYSEHKQGVDIGGFILSSFAPGLAGVNILRRGQVAMEAAMATGNLGKVSSAAFGLLTPNRANNVKNAVNAVINSDARYSLGERNLLKALGSGVAQNVLESAAFETAVAATMSESPVLEGQDIGDLGVNILVGAGVGGAIGGVLDAAKSVSAVKTGIKAGDKEAHPWTIIEKPGKGASASDSILFYREQSAATPPVPAETSGLSVERITYLQKKRADKLNELDGLVREEFTKLTDGDQILAKQLYNQTKFTETSRVLGDYLGAASVGRVSEATAVEKKWLAMEAKIADPKKRAKIPLDELDAHTNIRLSYTKAWGEGAGTALEERPVITQLSDTLKKGESIDISPSKVTAGKRKFSFKKPSTKPDTKVDKWDVSTADSLTANARTIWAKKLPAFEKGQVIAHTDTPLLEKAYREFDPSFKVQNADGILQSFTSKEELLTFLRDKKVELANKMVVDDIFAAAKSPKYKVRSQQEIAAAVNVRPRFLSGMQSNDLESDLFALDHYSSQYSKMLRDAKAIKADAPDVEVWNLPQHYKTMTDITPVKDVDGNLLKGMSQITQRRREYQSNLDRVFTLVVGNKEAGKYPEITAADLSTVTRLGAERSFIASASANYGSIAAKFAYIGNITSKLKRDALQKVTDLMTPALYKLQTNPKAAVEWSTLQAEIRAQTEAYTLNKAGDALVPLRAKRYEDLVEEATAAGRNTDEIAAPTFDANVVAEFPITSQEVKELAALHISQNKLYRSKMRILRNAQGAEHQTPEDVFYPIPINQKDYPFFATVTDDSITGGSKTRSLYANTETELEQMISKLRSNPRLTIRTKGDAEDFWRREGVFEYEKTIHDNKFDIELKRKGVSAPYLVSTDPTKITSELLAWHKERSIGVVMEAVSAKYEIPFSEIQSLGKQYTATATSKVGSSSILQHADEVVKNPYMDLVKTALDLKNYQDYPFWVQANRLLDQKVTQMWDNVSSIAENSKSPEDLLEANKVMQAAGYKGASYDMEMDLLANHTAPRGVLSSFIQKSNSLLATTTLRLDMLNAANNAIGANVLLGSEMKAVIRAIERGDAEAVGELATLAKINVPGTDKLILSTRKLFANSLKKFGSNSPEMQFYKDHNFVTSISDQYKWTIDTLTLNGKETVKDLNSKIEQVRSKLVSAADKGEKFTGNKLAEEFNRFMAADMMKQVTDIAVKRGLMDEKTALTYINTFVNRTQGNYLASQRPMMFQGPIGQSIGLFQTYQFNLMQQLLRHVGEGKAKDWATLLGLQGTIYGMNGLPAFNAINTHIVGTASGNKEHTDAYTALYGSVGKQAADWLMYGAASNFLLDPDLKVNLYTRGDINPRHVTIVPTNPADVPIYGAYKKFFGNLIDTADRVMSGGDLSTTFLQGLEHNGISRPLAGLAQTLKGFNNPEHSSYSTSSQGNVIAANDLYSLANLARLVGGKPMGDAIATDAAFRTRAYNAVDSGRRQKLGKAIKTTLIAGQLPTQEQIDGFAGKYVESGGDIKTFNKWVMQLYKTANEAQANKLKNELKSPYSQTMQKLMGGEDVGDFID